MPQEFSVIVWSKKGCHYCTEVKDYLEKNNLAFREVDVTHFDDRRDILETKYGIRHVPVVEVGFDDRYEAVTKVGLEYLEEVLTNYLAI